MDGSANERVDEAKQPSSDQEVASRGSSSPDWYRVARYAGGGLALLTVFIMVYRLFSVTGPVPLSLSFEDLDTETAILAAQLEVARAYEQRQTQLITWALGALVTVTAILAGFGWVVNKGMYDRDVAALTTKIDDQVDTVRDERREAEERMREQIESDFASQRAALDYLQVQHMVSAAALTGTQANIAYPQSGFWALWYRINQVQSLVTAHNLAVTSPSLKGGDLALHLNEAVDATISTIQALAQMPDGHTDLTENIQNLKQYLVGYELEPETESETLMEPIRVKLESIDAELDQLAQRWKESLLQHR